MDAEVLERPLPKPTTEDYIGARLLESLVEAYLTVKFLRNGLVRNAAGKAFQAWRALLAALLRLELDRLVQLAKTDEERRWLADRAVPRIPTSKMKALSKMLNDIGYSGIYFATSTALELHDYQYNGPDPDLAVSKYRNREEAAIAVTELLKELARKVEELKPRIRWNDELENTLKALKTELGMQ
ncbi:PaREP1 family protein [Vulcanisaeta sp. JCM 14467]|uniref:PaREP1 family protein n=1 Tax=Vulcanisaeta sp. JCM 14467 TaxID=1295370 RepID=UPI0006D244C0|nr:PaREP1 family protein [Vulcanisaeta sp. JCM 14467]